MEKKYTLNQRSLWGRHHKDVNGIALTHDDIRLALNSPNDALQRQFTLALLRHLSTSLLQLWILAFLVRPRCLPMCHRVKRRRPAGTIEDEDELYSELEEVKDYSWARFFKKVMKKRDEELPVAATHQVTPFPTRPRG